MHVTSWCSRLYSADTVSADEVLEGYRLRWQIELTFKRLKSIIQLGHIPKKWTIKAPGPGCWENSWWHCSAKSLRESDDLFPPGAMSTSPGQRPRSNWREFQFALHQVQSAIMPLVGLKIRTPAVVRNLCRTARAQPKSQTADPVHRDECVNRNPLLLAAYLSAYGLRPCRRASARRGSPQKARLWTNYRIPKQCGTGLSL